MPVQYRPTLTLDPVAKPSSKDAYVEGKWYTVTPQNVNTLINAKIAERESTGVALSESSKSAIDSAFRILAAIPTYNNTEVTPASIAPLKNFGSFSDYWGIFTNGISGSAKSAADTIAAVPKTVNSGLNVVAVVTVAVLFLLIHKEK